MTLQLEIIFIITFAYIGFTFLMHFLDKSLNTKTALEYIMMAVLVLVIMLSVLYK